MLFLNMCQVFVLFKLKEFQNARILCETIDSKHSNSSVPQFSLK